ncbi:phosphate acetyltransferase [Companilactobacillus sp.]|jgi:phosphate acetyltransferase|uniref:phosphate acetyltransferase n=1 Tax=Companilactobacillus sp. TaxID=2767905 RepID=UPI0025BE93E3|nr:phosphate acetyltransferase [Companilactobacillus sp.]MCH4008755.1 phosphate acetyltransferase [Companilactobacillus sp.]MCH4051066.1 phosphate acetyltransferase [Companilactobacillus sp.]MCH4076698.1 phosphate acetyltransferase [Companilactobacillus sp.]MCH4125273.1 phosphate acetyltransferase [Companilactobacillus sp.]MCH4131813.1 phosphate acetyltransferase [Companilactobacillus sp.]
MDLFDSLKQKIDGKNLTMVLPEGEDPRILEAAARLNSENILKPILLGDETEIDKVASDNSLDLGDIQIINPKNYSEFDDMVDAFVERRKGKNTKEQAEKMLLDVDYFGTMLVYLGKADGMVSGAVHSTGDTVRPALQIVKTAPGNSRISGAFILQKGDERYLFSDCAINIDPSAQELGEIAVQAAKSAKLFDIDPKVAMLSFSTKGSAKSDQVTKVAEATKIAQELAPEIPIDGELQFDAAFVPTVANQKAPDSKVAGHANVFVFPELQSGNIGYKIAQRFGGFDAVGPILLGLDKPISDLSRGANVDDVYKLSILTAALAL